MDGQMDDGLMIDRQIIGIQMDGCMDRYICIYMNIWMDRQVDECVDGWMDR